MATLKQLLGDAGAGIDKSYSEDDVLTLLTQLVTQHVALVASYNQLLTDYNAETLADHTESTATAITDTLVIE